MNHRATIDGARPTLLFCGGFHSNMAGNKATFIDQLAADRGLACTRFDYRGHGSSRGDARSLGIAHWLADTLSVVDATEGPVLLIGSSMGAWLSVLVAERRPARIAGLLTIAAAPDFVSELLLDSLTATERTAASTSQMAWRYSQYEADPWPIPPVLLDSGCNHRVLDRNDIIDVPATLVHGTKDQDVSLSLSRRLREQRLPSSTPFIEVVGGDHRLSDPKSLAILEEELDHLLHRIG